MADNATPQHVAIIMDGNGRWAKAQGKPRVAGHKVGAERVQECVNAAKDRGVKFVTLYAFSSENWSRSALEISALMTLLKAYLRIKTPEMMKDNVQLRAIGQLDRLPASCQKQLAKSIRETSRNDGITLILALSYGGRGEITEAARKLAQRVEAGVLKAADITETHLAESMYAPDVPDPDFLIRTSGEMRLSNFLLWQLSYAEIYVSEKCWPEFRAADLAGALDDFARRQRRFGR